MAPCSSFCVSSIFTIAVMATVLATYDNVMASGMKGAEMEGIDSTLGVEDKRDNSVNAAKRRLRFMDEQMNDGDGFGTQSDMYGPAEFSLPRRSGYETGDEGLGLDKRRLRFIKRAVDWDSQNDVGKFGEFLRAQPLNNIGNDDDVSFDKRRLRFIKRYFDDSDAAGMEKRRLRFIKRADNDAAVNKRQIMSINLPMELLAGKVFARRQQIRQMKNAALRQRLLEKGK